MLHIDFLFTESDNRAAWNAIAFKTQKTACGIRVKSSAIHPTDFDCPACRAAAKKRASDLRCLCAISEAQKRGASIEEINAIAENWKE